MDNNERMAEITAVQARYAEDLMKYPHVVGVGIGYRKIGDQFTDELCLVVMVDEKIPSAQLAAEALLPNSLEGIPIDVQEMGAFSA